MTVVVVNFGSAASPSTVLTIPTVAGFSYETVTCKADAGASCPAGMTVQALAAGLALPAIPNGGGRLSFALGGVTTGGAGTQVQFSANATAPGDYNPSNNAIQTVVPIAAPAASTLVTSVPATTYPEESVEKEAFDWINGERARCGMGLLRQDVRLDLAAQDHTNYLRVNFRNGNLTEATHEQNPAWPAFTGIDGSARALARGYPGWASDLIGGGAIQGFQTLFGYATYHSLEAQGPLPDVGMNNNEGLVVLNMGLPTRDLNARAGQYPAGDAVVTYPCDGVKLKYRFHWAERPSPLPNEDLGKRGPPLTVFVRGPQELQVREFTVTTASGMTVPGTLLTIAEQPNMLSKSEGVFIPLQVLPANATFNVVIKGTNDGQRFEKRYSFSTGD